jgi:hypothetical protein
MRDRLKEFALTLHPEKTRLIEFGCHTAANRERRGLGKPESFTFLGFKFICDKSRRGYFLGWWIRQPGGPTTRVISAAVPARR